MQHEQLRKESWKEKKTKKNDERDIIFIAEVRNWRPLFRGGGKNEIFFLKPVKVTYIYFRDIFFQHLNVEREKK